MKTILFLIFFISSFLIQAQKMNNIATDPKKNNEMLVGYCNRDGFKTVKCNFDSAYHAEYSAYQPDSETIKQLASMLNGIKITLVMATWCGDSKEWVPRFYKILDELNFNYKNLTLISVDRDKKAAGTEVETLNIERVPTFIFYNKKTELGRIIEVPVDLLEKNMLKILL